MEVKTLISVKDKEGNIYSMPSETDMCILAVHYSTSYLQFEVQDTEEDASGTLYYPKKTIFVPLNRENWLDFIAVDEDKIGEIVEGLN